MDWFREQIRAAYGGRAPRVLNDPGITWKQVSQPTLTQVLQWKKSD